MTLPSFKQIDLCDAYQYQTRSGQEFLTIIKASVNDKVITK